MIQSITGPVVWSMTCANIYILPFALLRAGGNYILHNAKYPLDHCYAANAVPKPLKLAITIEKLNCDGSLLKKVKSTATNPWNSFFSKALKACQSLAIREAQWVSNRETLSSAANEFPSAIVAQGVKSGMMIGRPIWFSNSNSKKSWKHDENGGVLIWWGYEWALMDQHPWMAGSRINPLWMGGSEQVRESEWEEWNILLPQIRRVIWGRFGQWGERKDSISTFSHI